MLRRFNVSSVTGIINLLVSVGIIVGGIAAYGAIQQSRQDAISTMQQRLDDIEKREVQARPDHDLLNRLDERVKALCDWAGVSQKNRDKAQEVK